MYPSQFAVFVCDYLDNGQNIIDFGCGSGRDALFFSSHGHKVLGLDASPEAIKINKSSETDKLSFKILEISEAWDEDSEDKCCNHIATFVNSDKPTLLYARFFLHAITEAEEKKFISLLRKLEQIVSYCAFEFRTHLDRDQKKLASPHYRRFIDPANLIAQLSSLKYDVDYFVEGFGMAKMRSEDAHVARIILKQKSS